MKFNHKPKHFELVVAENYEFQWGGKTLLGEFRGINYQGDDPERPGVNREGLWFVFSVGDQLYEFTMPSRIVDSEGCAITVHVFSTHKMLNQLKKNIKS
jgi:hypothetical protein